MVATLQGPFGLIVLNMPTFTIGSAPDNQLVIYDASASAHHALIRMEEQTASLVDLASVNGTYVNEQRIEQNSPRLLNSSDSIRIGNTLFRYEVSWAPPFPPAPNGERDSGPQAKPLGYTDYGQQQGNQPLPFSGYTPPPPPYDPNLSNPYNATWAPTEVSNRNTAVPLSNLLPREEQQRKPVLPPSEQKKMSIQLKTILIVVAALVVIAAVVGGTFVYRATRPQPFINVNSQYNSNMAPAGSTSTEFRVSGHKFSSSSSVTFLLDNKVVSGNAAVQSDNDGSVTTTLTVTSNWPLGDHMLTAQDASGNTTNDGVALKIVPQGQAHTPGPNGAPPDDATFSINATYLPNGRPSMPIKLEVTGRPDPSGGSVCAPSADGLQHTLKGQDDIGTYTDIYTFTCSGTYKGGKISFNEILTSDTFNYTNGVMCTIGSPYVFVHLEGAFSNATSISGIYSRDSDAYDCTQGASISYPARKGTWTGQMQ